MWKRTPYIAILLIAAQGLGGQTPLPLSSIETLIEQEKFDAAESILAPLSRQTPGDAELMFRLGYVQFRQRKLDAAKEQFEAIVRSAPPAYNSRYFLGRIALLENRADLAIRWLEPVVAAKQTNYDVAAQLAAAYQGTGQTRRAVEALKLAIQFSPWDGALYYRLGRGYQQTGQPALATEALATASRLKSTNASDIQTLMEASRLSEQGRVSEATQLGQRISGRKDADPATLVALGLLWVKSGLQMEALQTFEAAAHRDERHFAAQYNFGLSLLRAGRTGDSIEPLKSAVALLPQSLDANLTLGLATVMLQWYAESRKWLEAARELDPANPRVVTLLATSYLRTGAPAEAVRILRSLGTADATDPTGLLLLVEALNASRQTEAALEAAEIAGKRFPKSAVAQMALAQQLARVGRYQDARPIFTRVLQLEPGQAEASVGLADSLQRAGEHEAAIEAYRIALDYRSTTLAARLGTARSLVALRRLEAARDLLEAGRASHDSEPSLHQELARVYARLGRNDLASRESEVVNKLKADEVKP